MINRQGYTGNRTDSPDFLKVLLTLKDNIMKDINVGEVCKVIEYRNNQYSVVSINNSDLRLRCYKLASVDVEVGDIVLVIFNNCDYKLNLNKINNNLAVQNLSDNILHSTNYGIITGSFSRSGGSGIVVDDELSNTSTNPVQNKVITQAINGKQPSGDYITQGDTLTKPLTVTGGDSASAGKIMLTSNGQITDTSTATLFGRTGDGSTLTIGHDSYTMALRGRTTRPTYNDNNVALQSDIPNLLDTIYPTGSIYISTNNVSPSSFLGGTWAQLPDGYTLWTASSDTFDGTNGKISAGLPNITGWVGIRKGNSANTSVVQDGTHGALTGKNYDSITDTQWANGISVSSYTNYNDSISINAANSNAIYGNSSTVQPPALKVYMWRRIS